MKGRTYKALNCPFCGNKAYYGLLKVESLHSKKKIRFIDYDAIMCDCGAMMIGENIESVYEKWNKRKEQK